MGVNTFRLIMIPGIRSDLVERRRKESQELRKHSFWTVRQSDELIRKTNSAIDHAMKLLKGIHKAAQKRNLLNPFFNLSENELTERINKLPHWKGDDN